MLDGMVHSFMPAKLHIVTAEYDGVVARDLDADAVIRVGFGRVEVEYEEDACAFEDDDFVGLVLERNVCL
jgi:hypothetical protein